LSPCLWTPPICIFMTMNLMMKRPMKITLNSHGFVDMCGLVTLNDTAPLLKKKRITTNLQVHPPPQKNTCLNG
jgi:hypothetical protein